jgi:hypothetical protein
MSGFLQKREALAAHTAIFNQSISQHELTMKRMEDGEHALQVQIETLRLQTEAARRVQLETSTRVTQLTGAFNESQRRSLAVQQLEVDIMSRKVLGTAEANSAEVTRIIKQVPEGYPQAIAMATDRYNALIASVRQRLAAYSGIERVVGNIDDVIRRAIALPTLVLSPETYAHFTEQNQGIYAIRCDRDIFYFPHCIGHKEAMTLVVANCLVFGEEMEKTRTLRLTASVHFARVGSLDYRCNLYFIE